MQACTYDLYTDSQARNPGIKYIFLLQSLADAVTETQKRIAALKHDNGTPPAAAADEAPAAAEPVRLRAASAQPKRPKETPLPESKAPKRLSEFRVNPNIAAVFSGPGTKLPTPGGSLLSAPPPPAAPAASAADLLGGLDHPAPAAASSQGGGETDMWSNFADSRNTGSSTAQSISAGGVDGGFDAPSFGGGDPFGAPPAAAPRPPAAAADPFGSVTAARPQPEKPAAANAGVHIAGLRVAAQYIMQYNIIYNMTARICWRTLTELAQLGDAASYPYVLYHSAAIQAFACETFMLWLMVVL